MVLKKLDYQTAKKELIEIYEKFIKNPEDAVIRDKAIAVYSYYCNASSVLDKRLVVATNFLSDIFQCGDVGFRKGDVLNSAKNILKKLKE